MFGGGVYFADKTTKSARYAGTCRKGDAGQLILCRVALGNPLLKCDRSHRTLRPARSARAPARRA